MFVSKTGKQLTAPMMSSYWAVVKDRAGLNQIDFYLATKHYGVDAAVRLGLSRTRDRGADGME